MKKTIKQAIKIQKHAATFLAAALLAASAQAAQIGWVSTSGDFSDTANWSGGVVPTSVDAPTFNNEGLGVFDNQAMNVDLSYTIERIYNDWNAGGYVNTIGGPGTLTVQGNAAENYLGIANRSGLNGGGTLQLTGNVVINRPWGNGLTEIRNDNGANNVLMFTPSSMLTLVTPAYCLDFTGGGASIQFNGTLAPSTGYLAIQSPTVSFNAGHDSSNFGQDIAFWGDGQSLTINGGTVLSSSQKFSIQGAGTLITLNGANTINGANFEILDGKSGFFDVNADEMNMGAVSVGTGGFMLIDVDAAVQNLFFANSSGDTWDAGATVTINGFQEGVIKFGSDAFGLTPAQLAAIDGGIYNLTAEGYLTALPVPEPTALALVLLGGVGLGTVRRKKI